MPGRSVHDQRGPTSPHTMTELSGGSPPNCSSSRPWATRLPRCRANSGRQSRAALAPTGGKDGATCAGAHPEAEAMGTAASPVARLESALTHGRTPTSFVGESDSRPFGGQTEGRSAARQRPANGTGSRQTGQTDVPARAYKCSPACLSRRHAENLTQIGADRLRKAARDC